ncbi:glucagon receptor isoform X5 [Oncorhynchus tshawytscha]|uniref:glucagon receptor isoform X5 n=1 Tax=Oncorhynchus tshawytscha TaxID=74940 RepID=UPI001C3D661B|nr:glucagon receptor isoform X5 [Oncorhynchus tshawytscha]
MFQMCVLLSLLTLSGYTQVSSAKSLKLLMEQWTSYKNQCSQSIVATPTATGLVCNRTFDQYACWPDGLPGTTVNVSCPWYLPWYRKVQQGVVYRVCSGDGRWAPKNTSECEQDDPGQQHYGSILSKFRAMYTVGYSLSLGALVLALGILVSFRKLHCMRNNIHMNLFSSFILRAVSILIKDVLLDSLSVPLAPGADTHHQTVAGCRIAMVMMQYSVIANNYWLLVEGIYLHSLLVVTVFTERNYFCIYLFIGWGEEGAPLIFVLPWVIVKYLYENEELAKSTLTLIPLLGIHAILFTLVIDESVPKGSKMRLIRLFYDLLFNSFQGLLVAILYCFVNKEVQSEMLKKWKRWKLGKDIEEEYRHTYSHALHVKSGSIVTGNLAGVQDNGSDPKDSQLAPNPDYDPDPNPASTSITPNESSRLVGSCHNRMDKTKTQPSLQCPSTPHGGTNNCSTLMEDICLEERAQSYTRPEEGAESNF